MLHLWLFFTHLFAYVKKKQYLCTVKIKVQPINFIIMYYIIEGKYPLPSKEKQITLKNGELLFGTDYLLSRGCFSNMPDKAKRFKTEEEAQAYINRWLLGQDTTYSPKLVDKYPWRRNNGTK